MDLGAMLLGERHERQHVGLGTVNQGRQFGHPGAELVGDAAPLLAGGIGVGLGESGADPGRDEAAMALAGVRQDVAHEVDAAARCREACSTRLTAALRPSWLSEMISLTPRRPRRARERRMSVQNVSASLAPVAMPSTLGSSPRAGSCAGCRC